MTYYLYLFLITIYIISVGICYKVIKDFSYSFQRNLNENYQRTWDDVVCTFALSLWSFIGLIIVIFLWMLATERLKIRIKVPKWLIIIPFICLFSNSFGAIKCKVLMIHDKIPNKYENAEIFSGCEIEKIYEEFTDLHKMYLVIYDDNHNTLYINELNDVYYTKHPSNNWYNFYQHSFIESKCIFDDINYKLIIL